MQILRRKAAGKPPASQEVRAHLRAVADEEDALPELFDIGWEDYLSRGAVCAVEWSENVEDAFFGDEVRVTIEKLSDTDRKITIEGAEAC